MAKPPKPGTPPAVTTVGDDSYLSNSNLIISEDSSKVLNIPSLLANDEKVGKTATFLGLGNGSLTSLNTSQSARVDYINGQLTYNPQGQFDGLPAGQSATDSFTYTARLSTGKLQTSTVTVSITGANDAPVGTGDAYDYTEDALLNVSATDGVLRNDRDADRGATLTAVLLDQASAGTVTLESNGSFSYFPAYNSFAADSFTYRTYDGTAYSAPVTVSLTGTDVPEPPPANQPPVNEVEYYGYTEDTVLTVAAPGLLANAFDPEGSAITANLYDQAQHGTVVVNSDGSFTYTPEADYFGDDSFTYQAYDGLDYSARATVYLTGTDVPEQPPANQPPVQRDDSYQYTEDTVLTVAAPGLLVNDFDPEGSALTARLYDQAQHGTVVVNSDGSFTYTPEANYFGPDSFTYQAYDGSDYSARMTVNLTGTDVPEPVPANRPPVAAADNYAYLEDRRSYVTDASPGVLANDTDADGNPLTAVLETTTQQGTLNFNSNGTFDYTPNANYNGSDSFTYRAFDGTAYSAPVTVNLSGHNTPDNPVGANDSYQYTEDQVLQVASPGVLANDTDADAGSSLTAVLEGQAQYGSVALNANGSFTYTPNRDSFAADSFQYRVSDGTSSSEIVTVDLISTDIPEQPASSTFTPVMTDTVWAVDYREGDFTRTENDFKDPAKPDRTSTQYLSDSVQIISNIQGADSFQWTNQDTTVDRIDYVQHTTISRHSHDERTGVAEFNLTAATGLVSGATLQFSITNNMAYASREDLTPNASSQPDQPDPSAVGLEVYLYNGDGQVTVADLNLGELVATVPIADATTYQVSLDAETINQILAAERAESGTDYLGIGFRTTDPTFNWTEDANTRQITEVYATINDPRLELFYV